VSEQEELLQTLQLDHHQRRLAEGTFKEVHTPEKRKSPGAMGNIGGLPGGLEVGLEDGIDNRHPLHIYRKGEKGKTGGR